MVNLPDGYANATIIVQLDNGYLVQKVTPDGVQSSEVFADDDIVGVAYSAFDGHTRGKRKGGLEIRKFDNGTEDDKEYHDESSSTFYELDKPIHVYLAPDRKVTVIKNPANKRGLQILEEKK